MDDGTASPAAGPPASLVDSDVEDAYCWCFDAKRRMWKTISCQDDSQADAAQPTQESVDA